MELYFKLKAIGLILWFILLVSCIVLLSVIDKFWRM